MQMWATSKEFAVNDDILFHICSLISAEDNSQREATAGIVPTPTADQDL